MNNGPWNQTQHIFYLVAFIMSANMVLAFGILGGCAYIKMSVDVKQYTLDEIANFAPCEKVKGDVKDLLFELLAISLALMGGGAMATSSVRNHKVVPPPDMGSPKAVPEGEDESEEPK
jgi:hypothetical protein